MPIDPNADITLFAFSWVPELARGYVRDHRARWAMEEAGIGYKTKLVHAAEEKPEWYLAEQPFGQVPALVDGDVHLFESGAILLHLGQKSESLMPTDARGRAATQSWLFSALNSIEQYTLELFFLHVVFAEEEWTKLRIPSAHDFIRRRLGQLSDALGDKDYLIGRFTVADIMMATVLRDVDRQMPLTDLPALDAYLKRCLARPAFQRAIDAQFADFTGKAPEGFAA